MMSMQRVKRIGSMLFVVFCLQYLLVFYVFDQSRRAQPKHRFLPRHATVKEVRGPTYHVHKADPMPIALRERYESRRLLVESNRPRLVSRREILDEYRPAAAAASSPLSSQVGQAGDSFASRVTERYASLEDESRRGEWLNCGTCALVSNSGHIQGSRLGDEIDEANCVFRLNAAPSQGYELDVGRRTTVRVVSQRGVGEVLANASTLLDNHPSLSTVFFHGADHVFSLGSLPRTVRRLSAKYPRLDFYRLTRAADADVEAEFEQVTGNNRISSKTEFSTGLYALMIMKDVCSDIRVYGMSPENYCRLHPESTVPYSYFKRPSLPECTMYDYHENIESGGQRLMTERRLFANWAKARGIQFYSPSWE